MRFTKPWKLFTKHDGSTIWRPTLRVVLRQYGAPVYRHFLIDSGADLSLASRRVCDALGLEWEAGVKRTLRGISQKEVCQVESRIHHVDLFVAELGLQITIPICFAEGDAPLVLGREGFFEYFRITFDRQALLTTFEFTGEVQ